jgi:malate synthase
VLSADALAFVADLVRRFTTRRAAILKNRLERQRAFDRGARPNFREDTAEIRAGAWRCASIPDDLSDRRVEITGPVDRKMIINALNSGANVFMADFEDANSPTWANCVEGQINLYDAIRRQIDFTADTGKAYALNDQTATLMVRPRGWHLLEKHVTLDGQPIPASLFDFGLYFFHNARELLARGSGPYFYLPKLESHEEAVLWNDVFEFAQDTIGLPQGSIRATVLIETITAAFEMDEILYALRDHSAGLNCGRWDYIFSIIKKFSADPKWVLPDRSQVTMTSPCMRAYSLLAIKTCHRRGIHAIGGMAAQIPIKDDAHANAQALDKVRADKVREATDGHDGTWVAHPALVEIARQAFDQHMDGPNQVHRLRDDVTINAADLLSVPTGEVTERGVRQNIDVAIQYMAAWLRGNGCVPLYHLMEDAATAEISRSQLWQWLHHHAKLHDGRRVNRELIGRMFDQSVCRMCKAMGGDEHRMEADRFFEARRIIEDIVAHENFTEFMTLKGYERLD